MPEQKFRIIFLALWLSLALGHFGLSQFFIAGGLLPARVAIHWGTSGDPDGFADASWFSYVITGLYLILLLILGYLTFSRKRRLLRQVFFPVVASVSSFLLFVLSGSLFMQVGSSGEGSVLPVTLILLLTLVLTLGLLTLALAKPSVRLTNNLQVYLLGIKVLAIEFSSLSGAKEIELRARDFGGLGIRYARGTLAFMPSAGSGVLIATNYGESIAIRSQESKNLAEEITRRIES